MRTRTNRLMKICGVAGLLLALNVTTHAQDFTWTYKASMPHGRGSGAAAVVGDVIYNIGGHPGGRYNEAYNTLTNTWTSKALLPHTNGRYGLAAIGVNGKVYTFGGTNIGGNYNNTNVDEYNPSTNSWIPYKATYPISVARMSLAECNGKIYVFGGWLYQASNEWVANVYEYDPLTNILTQKASMPTARADSFAGTVGGKIYVVGGVGESADIDLDVVEMYDPAADQWTSGCAPMPAPARVVGAVINNRIYVHPYSTTTVYEYDPSANSWAEKNPMLTARAAECAGAVDNRLYIMGGFVPGAITSSVEEGFLNSAPVAVCQDVLVSAGTNGYVDASIDGGSYDPDGDSIDLSQSPAGPYVVGVYTVILTVTDPYGASDSCQAMLVVYDPSGGFVTGGGWIWSPKGAYIADPWLEGKANFGFVSKYQKGATVPTGQTEFVFQAGNLNFHSSSYDWLVVNQAGSNAQFKGSGTINGVGNYKFMLWAGDGVPDTFRIKIWQENGGEVVVYDNGFNQPIGGGSIVVHTK